VLETSRSRACAAADDDLPEKYRRRPRALLDAVFISLDIATSINSKRCHKPMGMVRARACRRSRRGSARGGGMSERTADDVPWLTLGLVRGLAIRMLWQDEPERFDRPLTLWRGIVEGYIRQSK
jgi:hypothetical protein